MIVVNPQGVGLNLDAACELANIPPEVDGGQQRLLVTFPGDSEHQKQYTVYGLTLTDVIHFKSNGSVSTERRWIRGVRPMTPGQVVPA